LYFVRQSKEEEVTNFIDCCCSQRKKKGITTAQLSLAWLLSKRICVIPKSNNILRQKENFSSKDAIYNVLHFSDDMDKISEGKDTSVFLLENAEKSKEDANRLRRLVWNDDDLRGPRAI
jgi:diketogulonate reductase-like aldo/keto reductase